LKAIFGKHKFQKQCFVCIFIDNTCVAANNVILIISQFIEERLEMLNNGLGFSDEFELEACNYSEKSSSKLKHQYKEWTYAMRKEGSALLKTVKSKVKETWRHFSFYLLSLLLCCL